MTEVMQGILAEARKNKFSQIKDTLSEDDIAAVWENVSSFIEKNMTQQKGVNIQGFGTFTFTQKKLDIGNNKFLMMQRPLFMLAEKFAQTHGLQHQKYHIPGQIPVVQLNYAALSFESPFDRDTVESCVKEILGAVSRAIGAKKNVELTFSGIGRLSIRESKVKMRFYKEFINQMDGTGKLMASMQNRPGTVDSVMSDRPLSRAVSNASTIILPKISNTSLANTGGLAPVAEEVEMPVDVPLPQEPDVHPNELPMHPLDAAGLEPQNINDIQIRTPQQDKIDAFEGPEIQDVDTAAAIRQIEYTGDETTARDEFQTMEVPVAQELDKSDSGRMFPEIDQRKPSPLVSRAGSRMAMPVAKASGISLLDDLVPSPHTPKSAPSPINKSSPSPLRELDDNMLCKPKPPSPKLSPLQRSHSVDHIKLAAAKKPPTPPTSSCGHDNAGQELCYLCHQRARRNVPVSFSAERRRREDEEDKLLQQYQYMKDAEDTLAEQENRFAKRHDLQKMAHFNLGVAEAVLAKKKARDTDFHKSYIFQKRPLTPPKYHKQEEYSKDLAQQVDAKETADEKRKNDEGFLERLEQVQLAEDLAAQRHQFLTDKFEQQEMYKSALEAQLRFKPLEVPAREPDNEVFGKNDMTNEKMAERRHKAYELFKEQQDLVAQRKREAILQRLNEQKEEESTLDRTKRELIEDRAMRYKKRVEVRKGLEHDWSKASGLKKNRELDERLQALSPSLLLHEQCDNYRRCRQCQRKTNNRGESNIWSESRYIPGSRLMV